ncbi:hypothetical protein V8E51_002161 [Hyaloscypha variabilis]|uniref:Uncharacterized protein n=1 Tax=Hyaloscypha variabilis (strain UAMH 11265 / GT02V1 / F) TaxID=1149755 RepID=A0A2J6RAM4_HYAVF|nr:hypothetical protein L207DRAFT_516523 [Hyaloscypha variabilis F]
MTKLNSLPSAREAYQNSPGAEEGKRKGRATSESGFGEGHGKQRFRHSEALQEIKNSVIAKQAKFRLCTTTARAKPAGYITCQPPATQQGMVQSSNGLSLS